jgi:hypothetical protein
LTKVESEAALAMIIKTRLSWKHIEHFVVSPTGLVIMSLIGCSGFHFTFSLSQAKNTDEKQVKTRNPAGSVGSLRYLVRGATLSQKEQAGEQLRASLRFGCTPSRAPRAGERSRAGAQWWARARLRVSGGAGQVPVGEAPARIRGGREVD